jgi:hypothetical protein
MGMFSKRDQLPAVVRPGSLMKGIHSTECLLVAQSGHRTHADECPLLGANWTSRFQSVMSAFDPKRTSAAEAAQVLGLFKNSN